MKAPRQYTSAAAFRRALEERLLRVAAAENTDLSRLRREISFDRLLARLFHEPVSPWVLKGGYALELRFRMARSTVDIDLTSTSSEVRSIPAVRELLQEALRREVDDWFEFLVGAHIRHLDAPPYGGARFPIRARMDSRTFALFNLDVAVGATVMAPLEAAQCRDWLRFAGVGAPKVQMIPREQHFAEKLHAYTVPRSTANSRVKDLVDLVLLVNFGDLDRSRVQEALRLTFGQRGTHPVPEGLTPPPQDWRIRFHQMAVECQIAPDMEAAYETVQSYFAGLL